MTSYINADTIHIDEDKVLYMVDLLKIGGYDVEYTDEPGFLFNQENGDPAYENMSFDLWIKYIAHADMHGAGYEREAEIE